MQTCFADLSYEYVFTLVVCLMLLSVCLYVSLFKICLLSNCFTYFGIACFGYKYMFFRFSLKQSYCLPNLFVHLQARADNKAARDGKTIGGNDPNYRNPYLVRRMLNSKELSHRFVYVPPILVKISKYEKVRPEIYMSRRNTPRQTSRHVM